MIIENEASVTKAVQEAFGRTADPRLREILLALVRHLHDFIREVRLTEREFQEAARIVAALGQKTTPSHNEVVLMAGSLGVSALVCLLSNGNNGQTETQANLLGPFWREDQPLAPSGSSLVRSATPGPARSSRVCRWWTARGGPWRVPRWMSGTPRPRASTRIRIRPKPR